MSDFDFSDLEDLNADGTVNFGTTKPAKKRETFPCQVCGGTGLWTARRANRNGDTHCFACKGKGHFLTSEHDRRKARDSARNTKLKRIKEAQDINAKIDGGELLGWIISNRDWNNFASSLLEQHTNGKAWTENQINAARRMAVKTAESRAKREAEKQESKVTIDLGPIREMFETALQNGHKRPVYRAEGLVINRAPDHGRNPGALYVKNTGDIYGGKVLGTEFTPSRDGKDKEFTEHGTASDALALIAGNPLEAAIRYGRKTGKCACCGRDLTNKESIALGIGPICKDKWGF